MAQEREEGEDGVARALGERKAQEAMVSLDRLVAYWDGAPRPFTPDEKLWGELLRAQALDLGLRSVWEGLPKRGKMLALADFDETLAALARRGVDMGQAYFLVDKAGEPDVQLSMPRAFPDLGIMATPDPKKVGLLR